MKTYQIIDLSVFAILFAAIVIYKLWEIVVFGICVIATVVVVGSILKEMDENDIDKHPK